LEITPELDADEEGYYPIFELLNMSLDFSKQSLAAELIKRAKDLPFLLCQKIVRAIKDDKLSD
jgi:hypothetical protein